MIRNTIKYMCKNTLFNSGKETASNCSALSPQIASRYPVRHSEHEAEKMLSDCENSQKYNLQLLKQKEMLEAAKIPLVNTQQQADNRLSKYTQKPDMDEVDNALKQAEANRKYSIY